MGAPGPTRSLADRVAEARPIAATRPPGAPPPLKSFQDGALDREGFVSFWNPTIDEWQGWFVHAGVRMGWHPAPLFGGVFIHLLGGAGPEDGFSEEGVAFFTTSAGLSGLIDDLQLIRALNHGTDAPIEGNFVRHDAALAPKPVVPKLQGASPANG